MEEFTKKGDEVNNFPPYDNDFQLPDPEPEVSFIQEKDFTADPKDYSARTEPSIRTKQLSTSEVDDESHFPTTPECSKEFNGKYNCSAPCLAKGVTPTNISSASTSGPAKAVLSMELTRRNKNGKVESHHRNWGGKVSSTINGASKMEKGKEPIIYEADDSRSSSNRREDGRENFECISSRGVVSTVKRARINDSESEKLVGAKVLKRSNNGSLSFMNWVTSMTKGLARCQDEAMEASQHPFQHMKGVISPSISNAEREYNANSHGTMGFRSIFQGAYHHGNNVSSNKIKYIDDRKVIDAFKGTVREKASNVVSYVLRERLSFDQRSSFVDSSFGFGDVEKENVSTEPINLGVYGVTAQTNDIKLRDKVLASSKRLNKNICQVKNSLLAAMDSCGELMTQSRNDFQNSLWVTRLSHGVSSSHLKSIECSNCLDLSSHHKLPYMEGEKNRLSENPQYNSVPHTGSVGSLRRIVTENYESKLQLIISSEYCRRSNSISSSFAQRLDALKHTKSSNKICLFCGMCDHSIWECSEVVESKLEQYLKSISLYDDSMKKASCFCILCFQLDHWAATCPNSSSKGNQISFKSTATIKHENQSFINYDGAIKFQSESKKELQQVLHGSTVSLKENKAIESDTVVREEVRSHENESAGRGTIDLLMDRLNDTVNEDKMKMTSSSPSENELKKSVFKSFCSRLPTSTMDEPKEIFVAVRKLRLSRMDILRWMKSRAPHYNLGGFFLRLRIGKLEKGLGATGYHVGCINGTSGQSSFRVCIGSSTHLVTSPFISNQDFEEDELMAWWFQNIKDGTKIPSIEELNEKFQLRLKFGL